MTDHIIYCNLDMNKLHGNENHSMQAKIGTEYEAPYSAWE